MLRKLKITKKQILIYIFTMIILFVFLPIVSISIFPKLIENTDTNFQKLDIPKNIDLYITKSHKTITLDFEEYVKGVVASEMPASFDIEALKAQAVACRTYALGKLLAGDTICDSTHCQVYRSNNISRKVKKAVNATEGQVLYYNNELAAHALYFSSSGGKTENSKEVFGTSYPYLKSVKSPYESHATHRNEKIYITLSDFSKKIKKAFNTKTFGTIKKSNIKILSRSEGGRVLQIKIGKITLSGTDLRHALNLYSTLFDISVTSNKVTITSSGYGHGVGMSQYGANGFALKGYDYKEILSHYYKGTQVH